MVYGPYEYSKIIKGSEITLADSIWVSDIFYREKNEKAKSINMMEPGKYICYFQYYENKIAWLHVCHHDYLNIQPDSTKADTIEAPSGLIGIFSSRSFKRKDYDETWYQEIWSETMDYERNPYFKPLCELTDEEEKNEHLRMLRKMTLEKDYYKSMISKMFIAVNKPAFLDGESVVVTGGEGGGNYTFKIGFHENRIISIEFCFINK